MDPLIIGICGGSGSGKTYLANLLAKRSDADKISATIISQDDFYKPVGPMITDYDFDNPKALSLNILYNALLDLKNNKSVKYLVNDFCTNTQKSLKYISPTKIIIVEGIFILSDPDISSLLDLKIFISAKNEIRYARRLLRDTKERGKTQDAVKQYYDKYVEPSYKQIIEPSSDAADMIIINNKNISDMALHMINAYVRTRTG